ncbi:MAG: L-histidine N(alpha)-methyltransferase [Thermodesulfobacteriota bacterium]
MTRFAAPAPPTASTEAAVKGRIEIRNFLAGNYSTGLSEDVRAGLVGACKTLPPKWFYDARGSRLFEEICSQPEYYPTRTEMAILKDAAADIMAPLRCCDLMELGSGANWKVRILLDAVGGECMNRTRYVPVDVSETALKEAAEGLVAGYPGLRVVCLVADFTRDLDELVGTIDGDRTRLFLFLGSTIGNFSEAEGDEFLREVAGAMAPGDRFLVGLDMVKERNLLERAYNDSKGLSAEFNKNVLHVINRELGAGFDPGDFAHRAFFNESEERVEMHLVARRPVRAEVPGAGMAVRLERGETIRTEICRKFTRERSLAMFGRAGLEPERWFTDEKGWFSVVKLKRAGG